MQPPTLFIADLHLTPERPQINAAFFAFLAGPATRAQALYILGDFFETWVGDDDLTDPLHAEVASALKHLTTNGVPVFLMHGNRDFLLAEDFCKASGATLISDPTLIKLHGEDTLLMHGDTLCSEDVAYQAFRTQTRDPNWQRTFLAKPLAERHALACALRTQSEQTKADKTAEIMDVHPEAVTQALRQSGCRRLIHGHTHRPAGHHLEIDGQRAERWVLPAWYGGACWLACDASGCQFTRLSAPV
ncbi:MAG: UDP-2,3-diacylglucosamine diphosphatase [Betaproteobacteria bacterium]|nr:UDP-2,3-diacylglucosamine diphosphatase [Betaproteobacteria bacterium]